MDIKDKIYKYIVDNKLAPQYVNPLMELLDISYEQKEMLINILDELVSEGKLVKTKKKKYALPELCGFYVGAVQANKKGFAFFIPDNKDIDDIFISSEDLNSAMNNDRVMVKVIDKKTNRSVEGEVYKILERANKTVVGSFERDNYFGFVIPDNPRLFNDIYIPKSQINGAQNGQKVIAEIIKWPQKRRNPEGKVIEIIGDETDPETEIVSIIKEFKLPEEFPDKVEQYVNKIPSKVTENDLKGRLDLRDKTIITIDGADAKDLDDAISVEVLPNGNYYLGVHIADVSSYVKESTVLDEEAIKRGTSIYLVDRVIPMLPTHLSNGICSLNPNEDRLTLTVNMEIDNSGSVVSYEIKESVIKSKYRMVYEDVSDILENEDANLTSKYENLISTFKTMEQLYNILNRRRKERGSIDFDLDEAKITLDKQGKTIDVGPYERRVANKIIEEFMLVCNETVAEHMYWSQIPFVYRIHEEPNIEKILDLNSFIHNFGYNLKGVEGKIHPKEIQKLLDNIDGTVEEDIISSVTLRSLQKARYSSENEGHFGLAARYYCHFTSPIRRYPDLIIHRIIKEQIAGRLSSKRISYLEEALPDIADHCSNMEVLADEAERATEKLKKVEYMLDKVGEEYEGIISGVTNYGIYVELENLIEGMIRLSSLEDDYYEYDEKHYCLIGERTKKIYRIGDRVQIQVAAVNRYERKIDFVLLGES